MRGPWGSAYSATALVSSAAALVVYLALQAVKKSGWRSVNNILIFAMIFLILLGVLTFFTGGAAVGSFSTYLGRNRTLTDRTTIWAFLLPIALQKPIFGRGFEAIYTARARDTYRLGDFVITEAHNGYLDVMLGLGFVGIILTALFILSSCRKAHRVLSYNYEWGALWISFLVAALVHNISESSIQTFQSQLTAVILFFSVSSMNPITGSIETRREDLPAPASTL